MAKLSLYCVLLAQISKDWQRLVRVLGTYSLLGFIEIRLLVKNFFLFS